MARKKRKLPPLDPPRSPLPEAARQPKRDRFQKVSKAVEWYRGQAKGRYRVYFSELDINSDPRMLYFNSSDKHVAAAIDQAVHVITPILRARLTERIVKWQNDKTVAPTLDPLPEYALADAKRLSNMQLGLIRKHFARPDKKIALDLFEDAFEMFANGELRYSVIDKKTNAEPSSGYFFLFAEFALTAIETDIEPFEWFRFAPVTVRTQRIFNRAYGPRSFGDATQLKEEFSFTGVEKRALAREFAGSTYEDLCRAHAQHADDAFEEPKVVKDPRPPRPKSYKTPKTKGGAQRKGKGKGKGKSEGEAETEI